VVSARPRISTTASRRLYDVIVLGAQLGGPLAAALLAKRGYRVLYVEHDGLGHGYVHGGFLLPWAPFVAPPLKTMPQVEAALHEVGLNTTVQRALKQHVPDLQLVFERHRLDLHADPARRKAELVREFGDDGAKAADALAVLMQQHERSDAFLKETEELPPSGMLGGWKLRREIARHPELGEEPALVDSTVPGRLLAALRPFVSYVADADEPLARTRPLSQVLHAPSRYPGGREGLRELLVKKLQDLGGEALGRETSDSWMVEHLTFDGGRASGVRILQSSNEYAGAAVVAATDAGALRRLLTDKKKHRALAEQLEQARTQRFLFPVTWVVPAGHLPRGMGELLLLETLDEELGALLVQVHPARRASGEEAADLRVVCAGAFVPAKVRELGEEKMEALRARVESHLDRLMPFAREHLACRSAPYLDGEGARGSRLLPHPLLSVEGERFVGVTGLSPHTPVKNLFLAGRDVLPGLGLEGELLAGVRAAREVHALLGKKDPLKR
jgi:phytoene dehydrogenase-like protein